jgi:hypothetical protein
MPILKSNSTMKKFIVVVGVYVSLLVVAFAQDVTLSGAANCNATAVSGTWTVPCGVTSITVAV